MNKEIIEKVDEIIAIIEKSPEYKKYLLLKDKISEDKKIMELINRVRLCQKDVVHNIRNKNELDKLTDELNNNPLYREYNNTLDEINNTFTIIENSLNNYFSNKLN